MGVCYETPIEKLKKIPEIIKESLETINLIQFDRAHFKDYGDFSLNFEVVYYINSNNYNQYMDTRQEINFIIMERFKKIGIEFAYPTNTVYIAKN